MHRGVRRGSSFVSSVARDFGDVTAAHVRRRRAHVGVARGGNVASSATGAQAGAAAAGADFGKGGRIQGDLTSATRIDEILSVVEADADDFDPIHAATAVHRLATHGGRDQRSRERVTSDSRFTLLMGLVKANLVKMNSQGLANVAWACAKLEHNPGVDVLDAIAKGIERELAAARGAAPHGGAGRGKGRHTREVRPQAVSNTLWAFGQLRYRPDDVTVASLCNSAAPMLRKFRAQELTNTLLGIAHLEFDPGHPFFVTAFDAARENLRSFQGQETSNLLWACARLRHAPPGDVLDALLDQCAAQNLGGMQSELNLSQCLWACARFDQEPPAVFVAAANAEIPRCAHRMNPEHVDCILWALATLGLALGDEAMYALVSAAARLSDKMDAEMLVKTHWALARLRLRPAAGDMQAMAAAARRLVDDLPADDRLTMMHTWGVMRCNPGDDVIRAYTAEFRSGEDGSDDDGEGVGEKALDGAQCAKLLCAYGRTRHLPPPEHAAALANRLVEEAERDALHPSAAVLGLWGASLLGLHMTTAQLDVLARDAMAQDKRLAPRSLAKIVWALAALGYDPTAADLTKLKERVVVAMPKLMAKDQEAMREAMTRLGAVGV